MSMGLRTGTTISQCIKRNILLTQRRCISTQDQYKPVSTFIPEPPQQMSSDEENFEPDDRTYRLVNSIFQKHGSNKPGTISFLPRDSDVVCTVTDEHQQTPYFKLDHYRYTALRRAFVDAGFKRIFDSRDPEIQSMYENSWNVYWGRHLSPEKYEPIHALQKVNHWPGSSQLGRKDLLTVRLKRLEEFMGGSVVDFYPKTYLLPYDRALFDRDVAKKSKDSLYIMKPFAGSCGRGIQVMRSGDPIPSIPYAIQEYICNPYLINGHKFDLRLYVACTGIDPLRFYLHEDGLARFATQPYDENEINDRFSHLTNYSLNRHSDDFVNNEDPDDEATGHKWSLIALKRHIMQEVGIVRYEKLMDDIRDLIVKTMISVEERINYKTKTVLDKRIDSCFELYGFDVMIDADLKPWLIEVNIMPSLSCSSPLDRKIKFKVLSELFHIVGVVPYDRTLDVNPQCERLLKYDADRMDEERYALQQAEDELSRCVDFERIYPPISGDRNRYQHLFEEVVWKNDSLCRFEQSKENAVDLDSLHASLV
ncbi:tubulin polyglutamylase TTLL5 [Acrasis kona]|uniref:Tubulin--tyrosine ligase-like protein 5 n=1 Tax=Acrasis kona TaxID=1008807 RepID=A0AAW2ZFY1_9EUKA